MKKRIFCFCVAAHATLAYAQSPYPTDPGPAPAIMRLEYFVDNDPGFGNGKPVTVTPGQDLNFTFQADITGLPSGFHRFYLRSQDATGAWSLANSAIFDNYIVPLYASAVPAANVVAAEYYIDADPGFGNAMPIAFTPGTDLQNQTLAVNVTGLPPGNHRLYIRTLDANGRWSLINIASFDNILGPEYPVASPMTSLSMLEYFIDSDPGSGNGTPVAFAAGTNISDLPFNVPVDNLSQGPHTFYIRSRQNPWSLTAYAEFVKTAVLPVTWRYVQGELKDQSAQITWATGSEDNTAYFEVEYSTDGSHFNPVGKVRATGNAAGSRYSYLHLNPPAGTAYYKIRQLDKDGRFAYSKTIMLLIHNSLQSPVLFPNPVRDFVNVALPVNYKTITVSVYETNGRLVKTLPVANGQNVISIETKGLAKGSYYIVIQNGQHRQTLPFLKQ